MQDIADALPDDSVDIYVDNHGARGEADKAMHAIRSGGVYLILPGGGGGTISKHPKVGVKQINFGYTDASKHEQLDLLKVSAVAQRTKVCLVAQHTEVSLVARDTRGTHRKRVCCLAFPLNIRIQLIPSAWSLLIPSPAYGSN